jgi:hypothetical protein
VHGVQEAGAPGGQHLLALGTGEQLERLERLIGAGGGR